MNQIVRARILENLSASWQNPTFVDMTGDIIVRDFGEVIHLLPPSTNISLLPTSEKSHIYMPKKNTQIYPAENSFAKSLDLDMRSIVTESKLSKENLQPGIDSNRSI